MNFVAANASDHPQLSWNLPEHLSDRDLLSHPADLERIKFGLRDLPTASNLAFYLFDYRKYRYAYIDSSILAVSGHSEQDLQNSLDRLSKIKLYSARSKSFVEHKALPFYRKIKQKFDAESIKKLQVSFLAEILTKEEDLIPININVHPLEVDASGKILSDLGIIRILPEKIRRLKFAYRLNTDESDQIQLLTNVMFPMHTEPSLKKLSRREMEVLQLLSQGKSSREIGEILFISQHTVDTHRRKMIRKMDVRSTFDLIKIYQSK